MGVAGAAPAPGVIVLAGIAGLLASAFSMAVGEYISVQSQRELLEYQIAFERRQLEVTPEAEYDILVGIYVGRGFPRDELRGGARQLLLGLVAAGVTYTVGTLIGASGI